MIKLIKYNLFTYLTLFLVCILPFYVIIQVFFKFKLGIPYFGILIKEWILVLLGCTLVYEFIKKKQFPQFELIDYLIFSYIGYGIIITLLNGLWMNNLIHGWRYDFIFFIVFLIFRHWKSFLQISFKKLIKIFLISAGTSLFVSVFVKFLIGEKSLILLGFSDYASHWTYTGSIPVYHGLEGSGIRRFQWIFDGPNAMAYFLIIYWGLFLQFNKNKLEFHTLFTLALIIWFIILTFSRSALLWIWVAIGLLFLCNIKYIYKRYKNILVYISIWFSIFILGVMILFQDRLYYSVIRPSSTAWHFERMEIWVDRFLTAPFWQGLATAGPGFRSTYSWEVTRDIEEFYIPESWFIQQLIEWWFIYFSLFTTICMLILIKSYKYSKSIFWALIAILIMNVFLHIFEATYLSVLLFIFVWLLLGKKYNKVV